MSFIKDNKIDYFPVIDMIETGKNIQQLRENKGLSVKKLSEIMQLESVQGIYHDRCKAAGGIFRFYGRRNPNALRTE